MLIEQGITRDKSFLIASGICKLMPAKLGPGVDQSVVERVKLLSEQNVPQTTIAKQCDISVATVRRYIKRQDETPEQEEARNAERIKIIGQIYEVCHLAEAKVIDSLKKNEIKGKDAAVIWAIHLDKMLLLEAKIGSRDQTTETITFKFVSDGTENRPQLDTGEVSHLPVEIQGDDMRIGGGEDLLRLPGGSQDGPGVPQE